VDWSAFVGLPWRDRGRGAGGYDCWGLLIAAFEVGTGVALPSHDGRYQTAADGVETAAILDGELGAWREVLEVSVAPFDVALMKIGGRLHVGLMVRRGLMLHLPARKTSVIEPIARFRPVLTGYFRHNQV
jgi:cell wall-associated NlpC family hydrolase